MDPLGEHSDSDGKYLLPVIKQEPDYDEDNEISIIRSVEIYLRDSSYFRSEPKGENILSNTNKEYEPCTDPLSFGTDVETKQDCVKDSTHFGPCASSKSDIFTNTDVDPYNSQAVIKIEPNWEYEEIHIEDDYSKIFSVCHENRSKLESLLTKDIEEHFENLRSIEPQPTQFEMEPETQNNQRELSMESSRGQLVEGTYLEPQNQETPIEEGDSWIERPVKYIYHVSDSVEDDTVLNKPKCNDFYNNQSDETTGFVEDEDVNEQNSLEEIQSSKEKGNEKKKGIFVNEVKRDDRGNIVRSKGHCCMFCYRVMTKLHKHFINVHSTEIEVAKLLAMPKKSLVRRNGFIDLGRIGDYHHNIEVLSKKSGELILVRRPNRGKGIEDVSYSEFSPCPYCLGFLIKKHLWHHIRYSCNIKRKKLFNKPSAIERRRVQVESRVLLMSSLIRDHNQPAIFNENILKPMKDDKVTETCKNDPLILKLGNLQFEKYGLTKHELIRQEMRQLGRLLLTLRELSGGGDKTLKDWFEPFEIDNLVAAVKQMCIKIDSENQTLQPQYKIPSLALKLGFSLRRCITIERGEALRNCNKSKSESLKDFLNLMDIKWSVQCFSNSIVESQESTKEVDANSELYDNAGKFDVTMKELSKDDDPDHVEKKEHQKTKRPLRKPIPKRSWTTEEKDAVMTFFHLAIQKRVVPGKKECEQCIRQNSALDRRSWRDIKYYIHNYYKKIKKMTTYLSCSNNKKKRSLKRQFPVTIEESSKEDSDDSHHPQKKDQKKTKRPKPNGPLKENILHYHKTNFYFGKRFEPCTDPLSFGTIEANQDYVKGGSTNFGPCASFKSDIFINTDVDFYNSEVLPKKEPNMEYEEIQIEDDHSKIFSVGPNSRSKPESLLTEDTEEHFESLSSIEPQPTQFEMEPETKNNQRELSMEGSRGQMVEGMCLKPQDQETPIQGKFDVTIKELSKDDDPDHVQKKEHQKTKRPLRKPIPKRSWTTEEKDAVMTFFHLAIQKRVVPGKKECEQCIRQNSALDRRSWRDIKYYIHNYYKKIKKMTTYLSCSNNKKKRSLKRQFPVTIEESSKEDSDDSHHPQKKDQKKTKRPKPNGPLKENILHYHKTNFYFGKRFEPCTDPLSFGTIEANQDYVKGGSRNFGPCASFKSDIFINTDVDSYNSKVVTKKELNVEYEEIHIEDDHSKIFSVGPKNGSKQELLLTKDTEEHFESLSSIEPQPTQFEMEPETKNNQRELSMEGSRDQMIEGTCLKPQDQETPIQGRNPWIERPVQYINPDGTLKKTKSTFHLFKILKPQSLSKPPLLEHVGIILPSNTNDTNLISKEKTTTNYVEFITAESVDEYIQSQEKNELVSDTVEDDVNQSHEKNELVSDTVEDDVDQSHEKNELVSDTVEHVNQSHEKNELVSDTVEHDVNQSLEKNELVSDTVEHDVNQSLEKNELVSDTVDHDVNQSHETNELVSDTVEHDVNQSLEKNELVSDTVDHDVNQSHDKNELVSDTVDHDVNQSHEKNELVSDTVDHDVNQSHEKNDLVSDSIEDYIVMNKPKCNNQSDETTRSVEDKDLNVVNEQNKLSLKERQSNKEKGNEKQTGIVGNEVKKNDRGKVIRTGHCCMFCYKVMNKLHRHFQVKHSTEIEVAKLLAMPINSHIRRNGFIDLARIGDYHHNIEVLSKKSGKLIVVRRPNLGEDFSYRKYTPCPYCLGFLLKKHLWLHVKHSCNVRREKSHEEPSAKERRRVQADSRVLLMSSLKRDHNQPAIFIENILKPMRDDKVTEICKNDPLILKLGNSQFEKYGLTKHESIRQEMRQLGRLLLTLRELSGGGDKTLKDWLEPFEIDNLVAAVKQMCIKIDSENQTLHPQYKIPPLAVKLRLSLRRCITIERGEALRNCNKSKSESLKDFLDLMETQWFIQFASILIDKSQESNKVVDANSEHNLNAEALSVGKDIPAQVEKLAKHGHNKEKISLKKPTLKRPWTTEEKDAVMTFFRLAIEKQVIPGKKECEQCIRQNSALERRSWRDIKYYIHNYCNKIKKMTTNLSSSKNKKKRSLKRKSDKKVKKSSKDNSDDPDYVQKEERKKTKRPLKKPTLKRPWTPEEKDAVITFFHMAIKKRVVPGKDECEQCIRQNSALDRRSWRDVKYYVYNNCRKSRK